MAQRFGAASLHQRDARSQLFAGYSGDRSARSSPSSVGGGYGYSGGSSTPGGGGASQHLGVAGGGGGYRPATPNRKGQYSDAVLNELESQNDDQVAGILGKVRVLKDMTSAIGDEIRDSSALADKMNDTFESTRVRLRGTMNRMLLMAERSGIPWKVWLGFFSLVILIFMYVWIF